MSWLQVNLNDLKISSKSEQFNEKCILFSNVDSLLEMSENVEPVANFYGSKPDMSAQNKTTLANLSHLPDHSIKGAKHLNHPLNMNYLSDIFSEASLQRSNNYRPPARKIEILKIIKTNKICRMISRIIYTDYQKVNF